MQLSPFPVPSDLTSQGPKGRCPSPVQELGVWGLDAESGEGGEGPVSRIRIGVRGP